MKILVVNAGSSSLKYQLFETATGEVLAKGNCDRIGIGDSAIKHSTFDGRELKSKVQMPDHAAAMQVLVGALTDPTYGVIADMGEIEAVGHRVVHGGAYFSESVLLNDDVLTKLERCYDFAPLHTMAHIQGIKGCLSVMPDVPEVLVFDTAFHQTMPAKAYLYPIPYEMYEEDQIRRYGAHGTSHRYVTAEMCKILGRTEGTKIITCHLGNGSSISAVKDGHVIDTSMGLTPLAGLEMGTRCGDIDPAIVPLMMKKYKVGVDDIGDFMNKKCGLLGVSGVSSDMREVEAQAEKPGEEGERARLAIEILEYEIKKYIGSYAAAMGGLDAVVFTAGIGENNVSLREHVCEGLEFLGIKIDPVANRAARGKTAKISADDSRVAVYMIPTNEEWMIAKDTERLVRGGAAA